MFCQIVKKEFPLRHFPKARHFVVIKANHKCRNEIEFLSEVGQRSKSFDAPDNATHAQQARNFPEHREAVHIKPQSGMTEELSDVKEIPCAAAKVEDALRARQIEFELANPANINPDPTVKIEIFWPVRARVRDGISFTDLLETNWIDRFDDPFCVKPKLLRSEKSERMLPRAGEAPAIYKLSYFMAKSHLKMNHSL
jgi:hypothetical protein